MSIVSYIALYLLLFDLDMPFFRGIGSAPFSLIISLVVILSGSNPYQLNIKSKSIIKEFLGVFILYILLFLYVCFRVIINQAEDLSYIGTCLKGLVIIIASLLYLVAFNTERLFDRLLNVFFINASIALFVGTFPDYQLYVNLFKPNAGELIGWTPYRNAFLSGSGYFGIGAPFGMASAFFLISIFMYGKYSIIASLKLMVVMLAAVFAARIVFFCLSIPILYLVVIRGNLKALVGGLIFIFLGFSILNLKIFESYHIWLFEIFNKGIMESDSGKHLFSAEFLKVPDNVYTFLFGDGRYISLTGGYYMGTDIGYLRNWYFGGVGFMIAIMSIPILMYLKNRETEFLFIIVTISLVLHFKGVFIYNNPTFTPLIMIISHILYCRNKNERARL